MCARRSTYAGPACGCLDATARDPVFDPGPEAGATAAAMIMGLVGVQLVRPAARPARPAWDGWHRVEQLLERPAVAGVGAAQQKGKRDAVPARGEVASGACLTAARRIRPGSGDLLLAAMEALSMQARLQSMRSAWRRRRSNSRCSRPHTPASGQSRSRCQQVMPDPQPISAAALSGGCRSKRFGKVPGTAYPLAGAARTAKLAQ